MKEIFLLRVKIFSFVEALNLNADIPILFETRSFIFAEAKF